MPPSSSKRFSSKGKAFVTSLTSKLCPKRAAANHGHNQSPSLSAEKHDSPAQEHVRAAWKSFTLLSRTIESCLDGTPFKTPVSVLNVFIDIADAVIDNGDAMKSLMIQLTTRVTVLSAACLQTESEPARDRIIALAKVLVREAAQLHALSRKRAWRKVLEHEDDANTIKSTLLRVDDTLKIFQVEVLLSIERNVDSMRFSFRELQLTASCAHVARYNADITSSLPVRQECTPGTRDIVLRQIVSWARDNSPDSLNVFWLNGLAGTGKTTIAYTICKEFEELGPQNEKNLLGASFFCSRELETTRERRYIVPTMAYQLAKRSRSFAQALLQTDLDSVHLKNRQMECLLTEPWRLSAANRNQELPPLLIVIDALDENQGGLAFLKELLMEVSKGPLPGLKFLITGRPEPQIASHFDNVSSVMMSRLHDVNEKDVEKDIIRFLCYQLPELSEAPEILQLSSRATALFIYAAAVARFLDPPQAVLSAIEQVGQLQKLLDDWSTVGNTVNTTPLVDEMYRQVVSLAYSPLRELEDIFQKRLKVLHSITAILRPLSVVELASLLDIDEIAITKTIETFYAVLYVSPDDHQVSWYHASFRQFLFDSRRSRFDPSQYLGRNASQINAFCDPAPQYGALVDCCFSVMESQLCFNMCHLQSSLKMDDELVQRLDFVDTRIRPSLEHACRLWVEYLVRSPPPASHSDARLRSLESFLRHQLLFWLEAMNLLTRFNETHDFLTRAQSWIIDGGLTEHSSAADTSENTAQTVLDALKDAATFTKFFASGFVLASTPHLYISALGVWNSEKPIWRLWRSRFSSVLEFLPTTHTSLDSYRRGQTSETDTQPFSILEEITQSEKSAGFVREQKQRGDSVLAVSFSPDGSRLASGFADGSASVWNTDTGVRLDFDEQLHYAEVRSLAWTKDGNILSTSDDGFVMLRNPVVEKTTSIGNARARVMSISLSFDERHMALGCDNGLIYIWDAASGKTLHQLKGHYDTVRAVAFRPDGEMLASAADDMAVCLWNTETGEKLEHFEEHTGPVNAISFSEDGRNFVTGSSDWSIIQRPRRGKSCQLLGHEGPVNSVAYSPDSCWILSGSSDTSVRLWDAKTGLQLKQFNGHSEPVTSVAFSPDCTRFASGSLDGSLRVWRASLDPLPWEANLFGDIYVDLPDDIEQKIMWIPPELHRVLYRPDNTLVISRTGALKLNFKDFRLHTNWYRCYLPDQPARQREPIYRLYHVMPIM